MDFRQSFKNRFIVCSIVCARFLITEIPLSFPGLCKPNGGPWEQIVGRNKNLQKAVEPRQRCTSSMCFSAYLHIRMRRTVGN